MPNWADSLRSNRRVLVPVGCAVVVVYLLVTSMIILKPLMAHTKAINWTTYFSDGQGQITLGTEDRIYVSSWNKICCLSAEGKELAVFDCQQLNQWGMWENALHIAANGAVNLVWIGQENPNQTLLRLAVLDPLLKPGEECQFVVEKANEATMVTGQDLHCALTDSGELLALDTEFNELWRKAPLTASGTQSPSRAGYMGAGELSECLSIDANDNVYHLDQSNLLHAFTPDGKERWQVQLAGQRADVRFVLGADRIAIRDSMGSLKVFDLTLTKLWEFAPPLNSAPNRWSGYVAPVAPIFAPDGSLYYLGSDAKLYSLEPDGQVRWDCRVPGDSYYNIELDSLSNGGVVIVAPYGTTLAYSAKGRLLWSTDLLRNNQAPAISPGGEIYFFQGSNLTAIDSDKL